MKPTHASFHIRFRVSFVALLLAVSACTADTAPGSHAPEPNPGTSAAPKLELKATVGGPSGWTVRYTAATSGFTGAVRYDFSSCGAFDSRAGELLEGNSLTCHHFEAGERTVSVRATDAAGKTATDSVMVTIGSAEVLYEGTWRWTFEDASGEGRSGYLTLTESEVYTKGSAPFSEFASRGEAFECTGGSCEAVGEAAIFFSQTGLSAPAYAFNLRLGSLGPEGGAAFGLTPEGQQSFEDGNLVVVKVSGGVKGGGGE